MKVRDSDALMLLKVEMIMLFEQLEVKSESRDTDAPANSIFKSWLSLFFCRSNY